MSYLFSLFLADTTFEFVFQREKLPCLETFLDDQMRCRGEGSAARCQLKCQAGFGIVLSSASHRLLALEFLSKALRASHAPNYA